MEFFSPANGVKTLNDVEQFISLTSTYALTSTTSGQKLFNATTNGALSVLASTTYFFDCYFELSSLSASSGSFGFLFGGTASFTSQKWDTIGNKGTGTITTQAAPQCTAGNVGANTAIVAATTGTAGWARVRGMVRINAAGTLIPQVNLGVAASAVVAVNSYFRIWPVGTNVVTNVGTWT